MNDEHHDHTPDDGARDPWMPDFAVPMNKHHADTPGTGQLLACPAPARGCDITCALCAELWNIDWLLRGKTDPRLSPQEIVTFLLGQGCPECEWGGRASRRKEYKRFHLRSLLNYFLSCEPAEGLARPALLSWVLHDSTNLLREHLGIAPIAYEESED